jgi:tetratricopeptide (TPR) repeat protein
MSPDKRHDLSRGEGMRSLGAILSGTVGKIGKRRRLQVALPAAKHSAVGEEDRRCWLRHGYRLLAIWGILFIAYSNSFQSGLVFDNASVIGQDPRIREATSANLGSILSGGYRYDKPTAGLYRPLATLSYLLNYAVFGNGPRPGGYHWVNLALHAVNVALVYLLGIAVLGETAPAWMVAAIWGLHPVLTESVTNIVGRADLLAAFGVLAALLCHIKAASAAGQQRLIWLVGIGAAQAIGLFSKESAVVLPAIMLLYDLCGFDRAAWRRRVPAYVALLLPFAAFFYLRTQTHMHVPFADNPLADAGFWTARLTAVKVIGNLLWLFLWPARLSADYSYNAVPLFSWQPLHWEDAKALLALGVCLSAALLLAFLARRQRKTLVFFLAFSFIALSPTSNLIVPIGSIMAERFLYLPSVGLAGCVAAAMCWMGTRQLVRAAWAAAALACLACAARTYARNSDWKDELSLWTSAVQACPESAKSHYNLGKALEVVPDLPEAIAEYRVSLRIDPDHADVHTNLGNALAAIGRVPEAIAEYRAAMQIEPERVEPRNNLANALVSMGQLPEAISEFRAALRIRPDSAEVHYNLANALLRMPGGLPPAIDEYQTAVRIDPNHADAHANLGNALARIPGRMPEAIAEYRAALRIEPGSFGAHIGLGNALSAIPGALGEAVAEYQAALRVLPGNAEAHYDLGTALARMPGRLPEAIVEFESALRTAPNLFEAHVNLANALAKTPGRIADAIAEYEAALRLNADPVVRQMAESLEAEQRAAKGVR